MLVAAIFVRCCYRYVKFTVMKLYWYKMRFSPYHGQMKAKSKKEAKEQLKVMFKEYDLDKVLEYLS